MGMLGRGRRGGMLSEFLFCFYVLWLLSRGGVFLRRFLSEWNRIDEVMRFIAMGYLCEG